MTADFLDREQGPCPFDARCENGRIGPYACQCQWSPGVDMCAWFGCLRPAHHSGPHTSDAGFAEAMAACAHCGAVGCMDQHPSAGVMAAQAEEFAPKAPAVPVAPRSEPPRANAYPAPVLMRLYTDEAMAAPRPVVPDGEMGPTHRPQRR